MTKQNGVVEHSWLPNSYWESAYRKYPGRTHFVGRAEHIKLKERAETEAAREWPNDDDGLS